MEKQKNDFYKKYYHQVNKTTWPDGFIKFSLDSYLGQNHMYTAIILNTKTYGLISYDRLEIVDNDWFIVKGKYASGQLYINRSELLSFEIV